MRPQWFAKEFPGTIAPGEPLPIEFSFDTGVIRFTLDDVSFQPSGERLDLVALTEDQEHYERIALFAEGIVSRLHHTPITAVGHNISFDIAEDRMKYMPENKLDEFEIIYDTLLPGAVLNTHRVQHAIDMSDYVLNLVHELDREHRYIDFNFHYAVQNDNDIREAIAQFVPNISVAQKMVEKIVEEQE